MNEQNLPTGWLDITLGDVLKIRNGYAFKSTEFKTSGVPLIRQSNLNGENVDLGKAVYLDVRYLETASGFTLNKGDVLIGMSGSIGKLCIYDKDIVALQNQRVGKIELHSNSNLEWRFIWLYLQTMTSFLLEKGKGIAVANISPGDIHSLPFSLPPHNEQQRIAAKIDALQTRSKNAKDALAEVETLLAQLRQSVLNVAFTGKLTAKWREEHPDTEPAPELLKRIRAERRKRWEEAELNKYQAKGKNPPADWQKKYPEPVQVDTADLPELPEGWCWASLGELFHVGIGATPERKKPEYWNGNIPWVSSGEVAFCRIEDTKEFITKLGLKKTSTELHPKGTVLIGMIGEGKTRGQVAILDIEACNNQNSAAIRVSESGMLPEYVYYFLESQYLKTRTIGSGNNQQALNKSRVQAIFMPLPPFEEHKAITQRIQEALDSEKNISAYLDESIKELALLDQSILAKAFRGELVPQDPNDEPASLLLDRIKQNMKSAPCLHKKRKGKGM